MMKINIINILFLIFDKNTSFSLVKWLILINENTSISNN